MEKMRKLAIEAAKKAGKILAENFGKTCKMTLKKTGGFVTNLDFESEKTIIDMIRKNYPDHLILSEESGKIEGTSEYMWVVDPLDGTHNYMRGIDIFGISIALLYRGEAILGVIHIPMREEIYFATRGEGAYLNGKKIKVSDRTLESCYMIHDSYLGKNKSIVETLKKLSSKSFNLRMFGSTAISLSLLAEGKVDFVIDYHDKPWDFSAGAIIVEEAGGKVTDLHGEKWNPWIKGYIASNGVVHQDILRIISPP